MVRELIVGRLDFRPNGDGDSCEFRGMGTLQPLIAEVVPHNLASPTRSDAQWTPEFLAFLRAA